MSRDIKTPAYDEKQLSRQSSQASSVSSRVSSTRKSSNASSVLSVYSRAASLGSQTSVGSFISRYSLSSDTSSLSSVSKGDAARAVSVAAGTPEKLKRLDYEDIRTRPRFRKFTVRHKRISAMRLRKITSAEEAEYEQHTLGAYHSNYTDKWIQTTCNILHKPASGYMLDFTINRSAKSPISSSIRLSHCDVQHRERPFLANILRICQTRLDDARVASVELPPGITLDGVYFPTGLTSTRNKASSAYCLILDDVAAPNLAIRKAVITGISDNVGFWERRDAERAEACSWKIIAEHAQGPGEWTLTMTVPSKPKESLVIPWSRLQVPESYHRVGLYSHEHSTRQKWFGETVSGRAGSRYRDLEVRDIQRNLRGEVIRATLWKAPSPKLAPPQPAPVVTKAPEPVSELVGEVEGQNGQRSKKGTGSKWPFRNSKR